MQFPRLVQGDEHLTATVQGSAAPQPTAIAIARLVDAEPGLLERMTSDPALSEVIVTVISASRFLTQLCITDRRAIEVLAEVAAGRASSPLPSPVGGAPAELASWKRLELLRIAARDLMAIDPLEEATARLAKLGSSVLAASLHAASLHAASGDAASVHGDLVPETGVPGTAAVIGMGKLGARELNYSSDIDVMFVTGKGGAGAEAFCRSVIEIASRCFRVDVNLRPEGRQGSLARTVASYRAYWSRWAHPWERQALLKARPVAGDTDLGSAFGEAALQATWGAPFGADDLREVRSLKARAESQSSSRGLADRDVKTGRGGIRDIEFSVQLLQLVHGRNDPSLREANTLLALARLAEGDYVAKEDAEALASSYRFLRTVEHRLQLIDDRQVHALPRKREGIEHLARVLGYRDRGSQTAGVLFEQELRAHMAVARRLHERLYFRPMLESFATVGRAWTAPEQAAPGAGGRSGAATAPGGPNTPATPNTPPAQMSAAAARERLAAFGFADTARAGDALVELSRGLTRPSRLMAQMLPLLMSWLSESPDPGLGLQGLQALASVETRRDALISSFRDSPEAARRLCLALGTSPVLGEAFARDPELVRALGNGSALLPAPAGELAERAIATAARWDSFSGKQAALRRMVNSEKARLMAADIVGLVTPEQVRSALTCLAEAALGAALGVVAPRGGFALIGMGRLGGTELGYGSDLDLLIVAGGDPGSDAASAQPLLRLMNGATPAERVWELDLNLRPEGRAGQLARSLAAYRTYFDRWARPWERQALVRARPVAGDRQLAGRFMDLVERFVWARPLGDDEVRELRRLKARIEAERSPAGQDPDYNLKLGPGAMWDVEWTVQLAQMASSTPGAQTLPALSALVQRGRVTARDAEVLAESWQVCSRDRDAAYVVSGIAAGSLPTRPEVMRRLALSRSMTIPELRGEYKKVTRRSRRVVERLFYGTVQAGSRPEPRRAR
ncbi:MAG: [protein-PII] uridylyltransferase family protein [Acidimicrobiales bacterium]